MDLWNISDKPPLFVPKVVLPVSLWRSIGQIQAVNAIILPLFLDCVYRLTT